MLLQGIDPLETICDFFHRIIALIVNGPWLLILRLKIVNHQQISFILKERKRIVVVTQLLLEGLACRDQLIESRRDCNAGLIKGCLVPVENLTSGRDRNRLLLSGNDAGIQGCLIVVCKIIKDIGVII